MTVETREQEEKRWDKELRWEKRKNIAVQVFVYALLLLAVSAFSWWNAGITMEAGRQKALEECQCVCPGETAP